MNPPEGAIWIHGFQMRNEILESLNNRPLHCPSCKEVFFEQFTLRDLLTIKKHTLSVKINRHKEKYIAIENAKKERREQPDYYIHLQYADTGSPPLHPFGKSGSSSKVSSTEVTITTNPPDNTDRTVGKDNVQTTWVQARKVSFVKKEEEKGSK